MREPQAIDLRLGYAWRPCCSGFRLIIAHAVAGYSKFTSSPLRHVAAVMVFGRCRGPFAVM
jgi:hypothetical protein